MEPTADEIFVPETPAPISTPPALTAWAHGFASATEQRERDENTAEMTRRLTGLLATWREKHPEIPLPEVATEPEIELVWMGEEEDTVRRWLFARPSHRDYPVYSDIAWATVAGYQLAVGMRCGACGRRLQTLGVDRPDQLAHALTHFDPYPEHNCRARTSTERITDALADFVTELAGEIVANYREGA
jgi:hypothetical protein